MKLTVERKYKKNIDVSECKPFHFQMGGSSSDKERHEEISQPVGVREISECVCERAREYRFEQEAVKQGTGQRVKGGSEGGGSG